MSKTLTASDRTALIRLASSLPAGSPERRAILAGLSKSALGPAKSIWKALTKQLRFPGWDLSEAGHDRLGISAMWEKQFDVGRRDRLPAVYGVALDIRLKESTEGYDADVIMGWAGPDMYGGRPRHSYRVKIPDAFIGGGRQWQVSPDLVRWVQTAFKKVVKHIMDFVKEDTTANTMQGAGRRDLWAKMAGRDPHVEARAMIDDWEKGLRPLFSAIEDIERAFKEAKKTVEALDRQGAGGTLAAPDYLKGVIRPMKATSELAGLAAKTIEKVVKDAGA